MRALQMVGWKQQPELVDVPEPEPGPGQVLIRVAAAGACHSDVHLIDEFDTGLVPFEPPFTLGHENAGWVEAVGVGVDGFEIGQPVAVYGPWGCGRCHTCRQGFENYCETSRPVGGGLGRDGGMAPLMLVPSSRWLVPLGDLDPIEAAPLTDAGLTPYHAIKRSLPLLRPGSSVAVIGAGGLGHLAVQILAAMTPAKVIAIDRLPAALDVARRSGASAGVESGPGAADQIRELTKGRGVDVALDFVGSQETLQLAVAVSRTLGHLTIVGIGGGTVPVSFLGVPYELSVATTYWGSLPELQEVVDLAAAGHLKVHAQRFTLDDALDAYDEIRRGTLTGRAVILP
ncbi:MAG: NAD(P)-dependent alcohol dehydrogenase [Actinomycetota bacterium]|nr:NAD(P)-dependent alcohol dehydrogenase [Actinomycetota bacterium]